MSKILSKAITKNITVQKVKGFRDILGQEYFKQKGALENCESISAFGGL